jgi:hypothetical protein
MTLALKSYKLILNELELQYRVLSECMYSSEHTLKLEKIEDIINNLARASSAIQQSNLNRMYIRNKVGSATGL